MPNRLSHHGTIMVFEHPPTLTGEFSLYKNVAVRRFALFNYGELKIEAAAGKTDGEYLTALSELSETPKETLLPVIRQTRGEVNLAHALTLR